MHIFKTQGGQVKTGKPQGEQNLTLNQQVILVFHLIKIPKLQALNQTK